METKVFRTNLNCGSCVAKVTPLLDGDKNIESWSVDTNDARKLLSVTGEHFDPDHVRNLVKQSGFDVFEEVKNQPSVQVTDQDEPAKSILKTYYPLLLIFTYLVGGVVLAQLKAEEFNGMTMMSQFMGGFFIVFSFFKILNLRGFADAYRTYDIVAKRVPSYGYVYPFIELGLGIAYLTAFAPLATNLVTLTVMSISSVGVIQSLLKKNKIQCACLGTIFNLPMSKITLIEDLLMVVMAMSGIVALV